MAYLAPIGDVVRPALVLPGNTNFPQWYPFTDEDADARFRFTVDVMLPNV